MFKIDKADLDQRRYRMAVMARRQISSASVHRAEGRWKTQGTKG